MGNSNRSPLNGGYSYSHTYVRDQVAVIAISLFLRRINAALIQGVFKVAKHDVKHCTIFISEQPYLKVRLFLIDLNT